MPKRPNPYGDANSPQFKTHVGARELAMGCQQTELMRDVYDRTYQKLFQGASSYTTTDINDNHKPHATPTQAELHSKFDPTQSLLSSSGHLITPASPALATNKQCGDMSGWISCHSPPSYLRNPSAGSSGPASPEQLCLNANGQLSAVSETDCAMDVEPSGAGLSGGGVGGGPQWNQLSTSSGGAGAGLLRFGFKSDAPKTQASKGSAKNAHVCETCRQIPGMIRCQFCERPVCHGCIRSCHFCCDNFCQLCSTIDYTSAEERVFCLNCAG